MFQKKHLRYLPFAGLTFLFAGWLFGMTTMGEAILSGPFAYQAALFGVLTKIHALNYLSDKRPPISKRRLMQTWYYDKEGFYLSHAAAAFPWGNIIAGQIHFSPYLETSFPYTPQALTPACGHWVSGLVALT